MGISNAILNAAYSDRTESTREAAVREIALLPEEHMTEQGLSEEEKNAKTAEFVELVSVAVTAKLKPSATRGEPLQIAASRV